MQIRPVVLVLLAALSWNAVPAQEPEITYKSTELAPGLYMIEGQGGFAGGNLGLLTGEDGVVLIDDGLPTMTERMMATLKKLGAADVDFVIDTHVHGDHIGGNEFLGRAGATIVAHDNLWRRLIEDGMRTADGMEPAPKKALPVVTFSDSVTLHLDGREAFVFHVQHAHTDGDVVIHFPQDNVIHAGDVLFNGLYPFIDLDTGGSIQGYIEAQKRILALADDETRIIPGHGPLADRASLQAAVDMLEGARDRVRALVRAGQSEEQILAENPLAEYHDQWDWAFITTERMTKILYRAETGD